MKKNLYKLFIFSLFINIISSPAIIEAYTKIPFGTSPQGGFAVSPGKTEISLKPGEKTQSEIIIINRNDFPADFFLSTEDFVGANEGTSGVKLLEEIESAYSLKNFIVPEITSFTLKAGEKITLSVDISTPENASPRGYYTALLVSSKKKNEGQDQIESIVTSRIASLFLVTIKGETRPEGKLEKFKIIGLQKDFYFETPKGFEIQFKNTGNIHLSPTGEIKLKNIFGHIVKTIKIEDYIILPNSTRSREFSLENKILFGKYQALASVTNGYDDKSEEIRLTFWVFPWKICLYATLIILLAIITARIVSKLFFWKRRKNFSPNKNSE